MAQRCIAVRALAARLSLQALLTHFVERKKKLTKVLLFFFRYKSLTSLQQAMELSGTLDSSQSGGRTSGDSGAGAKLPEKRCRKLSRPRSLTNLVWDFRGPVLLPDPMLIDRMPAKPAKPTKPSRLEPGVHRRSSSSKTTGNGRRQGTLYL